MDTAIPRKTFRITSRIDAVTRIPEAYLAELERKACQPALPA